MKTLDQIAEQLQGYNPQALRVDTAAAFLQQLVQPVTQTDTIELMHALGRVVAHDVISPIHVPPHDNSAMDGYAFSGAQLVAHTPLTLNVVGTAMAGTGWVGTVTAQQCVKIMTGAVMPAGLDTVVAQELVQRVGDTITIAADTVRLGDNRRFKGEDIAMGTPALRQGSRITPAALGLLASLGVPTVTVFRRLQVAYFSTGNEILSLGESPRDGAVYDSNRYTIHGLLTRMGIDVIDMGVVRDDPVALEAAFRSAGSQADAVITSGGVSVGEADHTKAMMQKLGNVAFWQIAMRPGRPMAVGQLSSEKSTILFGLPGNPVAVMVTFLALVRPALLQMMGSTQEPTPLLQARSQETIRKKPGRTEYQRAIVSHGADGGLTARTTGQQGSGVLSSMVHANGLMVLHHDQSNVAVGDVVNLLMFDGLI